VDQLVWCGRIKNGISLTAPNETLASAYLKKAEEALETMQTITARDWKITTAYYAMYPTFRGKVFDHAISPSFQENQVVILPMDLSPLVVAPCLSTAGAPIRGTRLSLLPLRYFRNQPYE